MPDVVVTKLYSGCNVWIMWALDHCAQRFGTSVCGFDFHRNKRLHCPNEEILFQSGIFFFIISKWSKTNCMINGHGISRSQGFETARFRGCGTSWCLIVSQSRDLVASFSICKLILHSYLIQLVSAFHQGFCNDVFVQGAFINSEIVVDFQVGLSFIVK